MNNIQFYCHTCEARVESATLQESGEYSCAKCSGPYVEILDDNFREDDFEREMVMEIADYDPDLSDVEMEDVEEESERILETRESQPYSFVYTREVHVREPQPYSFVNERAGARESQPYSFVNIHVQARRAQAPQRAPQQQREGPQPHQAHPFQHMFEAFFQGQNPGFSFPQTHMPAGHPARPQMQTGRAPAFARLFQQMFGGQNSRDFFHGDMEELLAHFQRRHEDSGKPPAAKKDIDALPTQILTKEAAELCADQNCAVCQDCYKEGEEICTLGCNHKFHKDCIHPWLDLHNSCPLCRKTIGDATESEQQSEAVAM